MDPLAPFDQAAGLLPFGLRQLALAMPQEQRRTAEELRLRAGRPISVTVPGEELVLHGCPVLTPKDLRTVLEIATQASAHTALERVRQGFVTVRGGHRVGLCGTVVMKDGEVHNLRQLSSLNIRIARQIPGIGDKLQNQLRAGDAVFSTLVLAPPGAGKTTLLRDLIRGFSSGVGGVRQRVGVADDRGELGAVWDGVPQLDLGPQTDVMDGCSKAQGAMMLLRGMNPQILSMDEITAPCDIEALEMAAGCGVTLLATAHGRDREDLERRPLYRELLNRRMFQKLLRIEVKEGVRRYRVEDLPC